jgi:hypothetical protein
MIWETSIEADERENIWRTTVSLQSSAAAADAAAADGDDDDAEDASWWAATIIIKQYAYTSLRVCPESLFPIES